MIGILGTGAFGTALASVWAAAGKDVRIWGRRPPADGALPYSVQFIADLDQIDSSVLVAAVPMQSLASVLSLLPRDPDYVVAACKGVDLERLVGPSGIIAEGCPSSVAAILSGPSFARDMRQGLPTVFKNCFR